MDGSVRTHSIDNRCSVLCKYPYIPGIGMVIIMGVLLCMPGPLYLQGRNGISRFWRSLFAVFSQGMLDQVRALRDGHHCMIQQFSEVIAPHAMKIFWYPRLFLSDWRSEEASKTNSCSRYLQYVIQAGWTDLSIHHSCHSPPNFF